MKLSSNVAFGSRLTPQQNAGMTLVELLVVIAIIAALASIIYPAVVDSIQKSEASLLAQRVDAINKAKVQYLLDNPGTDSQSRAEFNQLQDYLVRFGQRLQNIDALNEGTGGAFVNLGSFDGQTIQLEFQPASSRVNKHLKRVLDTMSSSAGQQSQANS